jgi:SAM-dependent methyltransferase
VDERTVKRIVDSPPALFKDALKQAIVAYCKILKSAKTFTFGNREYHYFYHSYNLAWRNERTVEVPIALAYLGARNGQSVLEVGNVLSHYVETEHEVLDKYEKAPGVINEDAVDFDPGKKYDLIISISTLEHIGWDETPRDPEKSLAALNNLASLLAPGGALIATASLGLNPAFDRLLEAGALPFEEVCALRRVRCKNEWRQDDPKSVLGAQYPRRSFRANAIIVGSIKEGQVPSD